MEMDSTEHRPSNPPSNGSPPSASPLSPERNRTTTPPNPMSNPTTLGTDRRSSRGVKCGGCRHERMSAVIRPRKPAPTYCSANEMKMKGAARLDVPITIPTFHVASPREPATPDQQIDGDERHGETGPVGGEAVWRDAIVECDTGGHACRTPPHGGHDHRYPHPLHLQQVRSGRSRLGRRRTWS